MVNLIGTWRNTEKNRRRVPNDSESEDKQWFLGFDDKRGDVFLKDVRLVVEDIGNQHEKSEFGFRIKEELQKEKKEMLKNIS